MKLPLYIGGANRRGVGGASNYMEPEKVSFMNNFPLYTG